MVTVIDLSARALRGPTYRVGGFLLDPHRQLLRDGVPIQIGRKSLGILSVLAEAEGALVTKDEMMAAVWPRTIVEENAIQAQIVSLRKMLGSDATLLSTARGLGYRLAMTADLPPPSVVLAEAGPVVRRARSRTFRVRSGAALLAAAGAASLWFAYVQTPLASMPGDGRIAIKPLALRSGGADARDFATDLSDQIGSALSDVQVPAMPNTGGLKSGGPDTIVASQNPPPDLLIDGTVQGDGKTFRVRIRLADTREGVTVWSGAFRGSVSSPEVLQATVSAHLADVVKWGTLGRSGPVKLDAATLAAFIAGREITVGVRDGGDGVALALYRKVVAAAPDFSWGHSGIATSEAYQAMAESLPLEAERLRSDARREARRALALEAHNGEAYLALQAVIPPTNWTGREALLVKGAAIDPGFEPVILMEGRLLWAVGRGRDALKWFGRAHGLDPLFVHASGSLALALTAEGRITESRALVSRMQSQWPELDMTKSVGFWASFISGSTRETLAILADPVNGRPDYSYATLRAWRTALAGIIAQDKATKSEAADATVAAARAVWLSPGPAMLLLAGLGDLGDAFAQARAHDDVDPLIQPPYLFLPAAAQLRADPRFMDVAQQKGLVDYWRKSEHWPDFCSEPGLPYDCRAEAAKVAG